MSNKTTDDGPGILLRMWRGSPQALAILGALLVWWAVAHYELLGRTVVAAPFEVVNVLREGEVWLHALNTFWRAIQGWFYAILIGTVVGLLIGRARLLFISSEPLVEFVRSVPPVILFPLLLTLFPPDSIAAYIWTIVIGCTPVMILAVARRLQQISEAKIELLNLYKVGRPIRWAAMSMEILPGLFFGSRVVLSIAIVISVVAEMVVAPNRPWALGAFARDALMAFDTAKYYAAVLLIGVFGYLSNYALRLLEGGVGSNSEQELDPS